MSRRTIRLTGSGIRGTSVSAVLLRDLLDVLIEGSKRVLRLQIEGRSTARGTQPAWLDQATNFDVMAIEEGSTLLVLDGPTLHQAIPERFGQMPLFGGIDAERSALDYLRDSLRDAAASRDDSELFDGPVIQTFSKLERIMKRGVDAIELEDGDVLRLESAGIDNITKLRARIPASRHVRVSGKLETIKHSDRRFVLLQDGASIPGVADERIEPDHLASLFGQQVVVSGDAYFRPSGTLLRVEAERIEPAKGDVSLWSTMPRPLLEGETAAELHRRQGARSGVSSIFGKWPGDEDDAVLDEVLRQLS